MVCMRNILLALTILGIFVDASVARGAANQRQTQDTAELCTKGIDYSSVSEILVRFGIEEEEFERSPSDVKCLVKYAAVCQYFAEEEPYDEKRRKVIDNALMKYCVAAQNQAKILTKKYKGQDNILLILEICKGDEGACATFDPKLVK